MKKSSEQLIFHDNRMLAEHSIVMKNKLPGGFFHSSGQLIFMLCLNPSQSGVPAPSVSRRFFQIFIK